MDRASKRDIDKDFLMPIEDVFSITGRGTVATGRIESGIANSGDEVDIIGMGAEKLKSTITGIEMFRKILDKGEAGDNAGILQEVSKKLTFQEVWLFVSQDQLLLTLSLRLRCIS